MSSQEQLDEAWALLFPLFLSRRDLFFSTLAEHGLTPPHGIALMSLLGGPRRMGDLATQMACDASYITAVVDRLDSLGLAERRPSAADRRVREVLLTDRGRSVALDVQATMSTAPEAFATLSARDCAALVRILRKVQPAMGVESVPRRG